MRTPSPPTVAEKDNAVVDAIKGETVKKETVAAAVKKENAVAAAVLSRSETVKKETVAAAVKKENAVAVKEWDRREGDIQLLVSSGDRGFLRTAFYLDHSLNTTSLRSTASPIVITFEERPLAPNGLN
jgi:hypothetical protein